MWVLKYLKTQNTVFIEKLGIKNGFKWKGKNHTSICFTWLKTTLYCNLLYSIVLYYNKLYGTILHGTLLYYTLLYNTILYCTILHFTVLYSKVGSCSPSLRTLGLGEELCVKYVLHSPQYSVLYCTVLYYTVLYCTEYSSVSSQCTVNTN